MAVELLNMCTHAQVPLNFYERILRLFKNYATLHMDDDHNTTWKSIPTTRDKLLLAQLKAQIPCVQPHSYLVTSTNDIVSKFEFKAQLLDLFSSSYFQDVEACCVNASDTDSLFGKYQPLPGEDISELVSAEWYQETYDSRIGNHWVHFDPVSGKHYHNSRLGPVVVYNDKTSVSNMEGSYSLEPVMFTLGFL